MFKMPTRKTNKANIYYGIKLRGQKQKKNKQVTTYKTQVSLWSKNTNIRKERSSCHTYEALE